MVMMKRQEDAVRPASHESRPKRYRRGIALASATTLLLVGVVVGADQASRLVAESLQAMASDMPEKQIAKPLGQVEPTPMVSAPYQPERLKGFKAPEPVAETQPTPATTSDEGEADTAAAAPEPEGLTTCDGGTQLEQDICADAELVALDQRIASALPNAADPRYREYMQQREHWCAPQPSRANRQECLLDLGNRLLGKL